MMNSFYSEKSSPLLSIGTLSRLSGVPVETLRTWERRYGFPEPVRLSSGHRRYPTDIVHQLRLVKRATRLGFKASYAIGVSFNELESIVVAAEVLDGDVSETSLQAALRREVELWVELAAQLDGLGFDRAVRRSWSEYGARSFVVHVAVPFLRRLGTLWQRGEITVAHEHFASEHLSSFLAEQWRPVTGRAENGKVVLANLEGDFIHLGIRMAAVFLALNHFDIIFLGHNTPLDDLISAAREEGVVTVVIGLSPVSDLPRSAEALRRLRAALPSSTSIVVGGNNALESIPGVTQMDSLDRFADFAGSLADVYRGARH